MDQNFEPSAPSAAISGERRPIPAYPSQSDQRVSAGTAGTATFTGASSTLARQAERWLLEKRRISRETLDKLGVECATEQVFFPDLREKSAAVVFRYGSNGWKARAVPEKGFVSNKGFKLSFFNEERVVRAVKAGNVKTVYLTEGEMDACALVEAGISPEAVLSVPNGAKKHANDEPAKSPSYKFVDEALLAGLNQAKRFVWCGDQDEAGMTLRTDMLALLGAARFAFVDWPEGIKDANELLIARGKAELKDVVENGAQPWPVAGLYRISELPEPPPLTLWNPGFPEWESKLLLAPRTLSVATGHPGHGKTILWGQIWYQVSRAYDVIVCQASFETRPKPHLRRQLRSLYCGRLEKELTIAQTQEADRWIEDHYLFIVHPEQKPTLRWLLDIAETAVVRHGAKVIQIDPWNRLESARDARQESETDYIGRCLRELHAFAHDMNCHVQVIAHPAKMDSARKGHPPTLEDISGSKNWDNAVDQGFVVYRPEMFDGTNRKTEATLFHRKCRFEELGYPCKLDVDYDLRTGSYRSVDYDVPMAPPPGHRARKDKSA